MAYKPERPGKPAYRDRNEKNAGRREGRRDPREDSARRERTAEPPRGTITAILSTNRRRDPHARKGQSRKANIF